MSYTISPSEDGEYIVLKVNGEIDRVTALRYNLEAHTLGKKLKISKYLFDVTEARHKGSAVEDYQFAHSDMSGMKEIDKTARIATLAAPDDHSHDFIETVSRNAGFDMKLFTRLDEAIQFLTDDQT
ncbi:MAG: hypothetical protein JXA04_07935 [Gammaproteobacteria bacterium]|nr:hypothetical protein [Gammaproteobacteria bacterium]